MRIMPKFRLRSVLVVLFAIILIWSVIKPKDYLLWILEVAPALVGIAVLFYLKQKFTSTTYIWCFIAASIMTIGAHYSYSEVPLFNFIRDTFDLERNNFDKMGHIVQGILPVLISQEVFIRKQIIDSSKWINFLSLCIALSVAAVYEIIEWSTIIFSGDTTENFLGMQGYIWDAQSDMFFALGGALLSLLFSKSMRLAITKDEFE